MYIIVQQILNFIYIFLNLHNLINIDHRLLNFLVVTRDIIMEGTMSQIFSLGPRSNFI